MKLFVWKNVLSDYTDGIMFAYAGNLEEAKGLILSNFGKDWEKRNLQWVFENKKPEIYETPYGFALWGGG
jgi:hypothetical protein